MRTHLTPPLVLAALTLAFFFPQVQNPTHILYSDTSDLLAEHLPARHFLIRSWHETGELPLWNPYHFAGSPFLHDPQVGIFYPPYAIFYFLPEASVGPVFSWLVIAHVWVAAWGAFVYARSQGLAFPAALVAGVGFPFSGKVLLHLLAAGHTVLVGLAWLPWLLWVLHGASRRFSWLRVVACSGLVALMILGTHPQWTFYGLLLAVFWSLGAALEEAGFLNGSGASSWARTQWVLGCWAGTGLLSGTLALLITAVQLLPTLEAASLSSRSGGVGTTEILEGGLRALTFFLGPSLTKTPSCLQWEDRGGFGVLWVAAAITAPFLCTRARIRYQAGVTLALIVFALGGAFLVQGFPGFRFFRQPTRMLVVATLPMAYLAGVTVQRLSEGLTSTELRIFRHILLRVVVVAGILVGGFALRLSLMGTVPLGHLYWVSLVVTLPVAALLLWQYPRGSRVSWVLLLLGDLAAFGSPLVQVRPESEVYALSECVAHLIPPGPGHFRVLDRDLPGPGVVTPLGGGAPLALLHGIESLRGYNPLDNRRYRAYLDVASGGQGNLVPFQDPLTFPVLSSFPVAHPQLLDLLGTRYLLEPVDIASKDPRMHMPEDRWRTVCVDPAPVGFDMGEAGVRSMDPFVIRENFKAFPRAFVVPEAVRLPEDPAEAATALTTADFHQRVFLETDLPSPTLGAGYRPARITAYGTGRVEIEAQGPGWLVLADLWYPGWHCTVDGTPAPLLRANGIIRATPLDTGEHTITFRFEPASWIWGQRLSIAGLVVLTLLGLLGCRQARSSPLTRADLS